MNNKRILKYLLIFFALALGIYAAFFYFILPMQHEAQQQRMEYQRVQEWEAHLEHARMQSYLQHYPEAEAEYLQLLDTQPDSVDVKMELATIFYYQKKYSQAFNLLETIPPEKRNPKITLLLANLYLVDQNYSKAEALYREYLQQVPTDQKIILQLADVLSWQKRYEEAITLYQQVLAHDPQNIQIRRHYAKILIWMGKQEEGAEELKETLKD